MCEFRHQRLDRRFDGVLTAADAEIEHGAGHAAKAMSAGQALELLDQPGLADPGLSPDMNDGAIANLRAGGEQSVELVQFGTASHKGTGSRAGSRHPKIAQTPWRPLPAFQIQQAIQRIPDRVRNQDASRIGQGGEPAALLHGRPRQDEVRPAIHHDQTAGDPDAGRFGAAVQVPVRSRAARTARSGSLPWARRAPNAAITVLPTWRYRSPP